MREIKFRYIWKRIDDGPIHVTITPIECLEGRGDVPFLGNHLWEMVVRSEYTGLKDRNGVEIFEGDILSARSHWGGPDSKLPKVKKPFITSNWVVEWIAAGWDLRSINFKESGGYAYTNGDWFRHMAMLPTDEFCRELYEPIVIGNIYENPELLEAKCPSHPTLFR